MKSLTESNLTDIKSVAISFLYMDVEETEVSPVVVMHPIFESGFQQAIGDDGNPTFINILEDKKGLDNVRITLKKLILSKDNVWGVYAIIRKSYRLTFLKYTKQYLSLKDFSELFADAWVMSENPNGDANVSLKMAVTWFRECDKTIMMDANEYRKYSSFPEIMEVYRGVAVGRKPKGLSWTADKSKADWFAHRYDRGEKMGYTQSAIVQKKNVLAYFESRGEAEVVVDTFSLTQDDIKIVE